MITNVVGCSTKTNEETIFTKDEEITSQTSEVSKETTTDSTTETTTEELKDSDGLEFVSLGDGTALVRGIGTCNDKNIVIPSKTPEGDTVIEIAAGAFAKNIDIVSIKLPDTVKLIGRGAFSSCWSLTSITIPNSVTEIEASAFEECKALESCVLPDSLPIISPYAACRGSRRATLGR